MLPPLNRARTVDRCANTVVVPSKRDRSCTHVRACMLSRTANAHTRKHTRRAWLAGVHNSTTAQHSHAVQAQCVCVVCVCVCVSCLVCLVCLVCLSSSIAGWMLSCFKGRARGSAVEQQCSAVLQTNIHLAGIEKRVCAVSSGGRAFKVLQRLGVVLRRARHRKGKQTETMLRLGRKVGQKIVC